MGATNNGGPAFPHALEKHDNYTGANWREMHGGMTLRDYFAAKAMVAILSNCSPEKGGVKYSDVAEEAYAFAGAMLAAREVPAPNDGWIAYKGGSCPVASDAYVQIKYAGDDTDAGRAENLRWGWMFGGKDGGDIVAYRIVTP